MQIDKLDIFYEDIQPLKLKKLELKNQLKILINNELKKMGIITIILCSDKYLLEMNRKYLNHDYFTDIITFDYVENGIISGDLFISFERVIENTKQFNTEIAKELYRVIFHGVLHLTGYNDKTREEKATMKQKEDFYLSAVDFKDIVV